MPGLRERHRGRCERGRRVHRQTAPAVRVRHRHEALRDLRSLQGLFTEGPVRHVVGLLI
ncbi:hypothetical protein SGPA1_60078 [Streptomyces misionensis JCM 4497]